MNEAAVSGGERVWSTFQTAIFEDVRSGEGHTVVMALAGCGKTTTIVEALRYLPRGASSVLFAFNKAIAKELEGRAPQGVAVSTLHSYGNRALYRAFGKLPIDEDKSLRIVEEVIPATKHNFDVRRAVAKVVELAKGALAGSRDEIEDLIDAFGIEEAGHTPKERSGFIGAVEHVLERSKALVGDKLAIGRIDWSDMIWLPIVLDLKFPTFSRVFIDETQDLNACQLELALRACKPGGRILAVGDENQAIYRFRGADENAIQRVIDRLSAKVLPLSVTYRCGKSIVRQANRYVPALTAYEGNGEGSVVGIGQESMMQAVGPGDFILSRTNAPLVGICLDLVLAGRRANIQGKDLGVQLAQIVRRSRGKTVEEVLAFVDDWEEEEVLRLESRDRPTDVITDKAECLRAISRRVDSVEALLERLKELFGDSKDDASRVVLSTTHKAKGLERDRVFVLADTYLRGRRIRGKDEIAPPSAEETALYYVAVTRARNELYLVRGER